MNNNIAEQRTGIERCMDDYTVKEYRYIRYIIKSLELTREKTRDALLFLNSTQNMPLAIDYLYIQLYPKGLAAYRARSHEEQTKRKEAENDKEIARILKSNRIIRSAQGKKTTRKKRTYARTTARQEEDALLSSKVLKDIKKACKKQPLVDCWEGDEGSACDIDIVEHDPVGVQIVKNALRGYELYGKPWRIRAFTKMWTHPSDLSSRELAAARRLY